MSTPHNEAHKGEIAKTVIMPGDPLRAKYIVENFFENYKLVKEGTITKEQAEHHPQKNMLMKALGCNAFVEPDVMVKGFLKDDIIIMCSDGLTNLVDQTTIYEMASKNIEQATKDLVILANDRGGHDNITVIIIKNI